MLTAKKILTLAVAITIDTINNYQQDSISCNQQKAKTVPPSPLSPSAKQIADLVESLANGSQRKFARLVGCAQPVISRILNGKQEPGRDLLERVAKLDEVDRDLLISTWKAQSGNGAYVHNQIPIAQGILTAPPMKNQELLTTKLVEVTSRLCRQSVYAVHASQCWPAVEDEAECMRPDDLVIIESSVKQYRNNIQMLDDKLVVITRRDSQHNSITMQRVHVESDETGERRLFVGRSTILGQPSRQNKTEGRYPRAITLEIKDCEQSESDLGVTPKDVVGVALELVRSL